MFQAYKKYWLNYANFEGRSGRADFWWVVLCNFLISLPVTLIGIFLFYFNIFSFLASNPTALEYMSDEEVLAFGFELVSSIMPILILSLVWWLVTLLPNLALEVRRYRDAGFHWAFIFLNLGLLVGFIPVLGWLISLGCQIARLVLLVQPSKAELDNYSIQDESLQLDTSEDSEEDPLSKYFEG